MSRLQRAAVLLTLLDALKRHGSWCGETHIQKAVYILQEICGVPLGFSFVLYRHGPYSFELCDELTALRADMLLVVQPRPPYGPSLAPGEHAERLLENFERTRQLYLRSIEYVAGHLGPHRVVDLEKLATALFVTRELKSADVTARVERLRALKPHIEVDDAVRAIGSIDAMLQGFATSMRP
jgi:hypothetical protein